MGPLHLYSSAGLFLRFIATPQNHGFAWMPRWPAPRLTAFVYDAAEVDDRLSYPSARTVARKFIDKCLRRLSKPPLRAPALYSSALVGMVGQRSMAGIIRSVHRALRDPSAAQHVTAKVSARLGADPKWTQHFNASAVCRDFELDSLRDHPAEALGALSRMASLKVVRAAWKLPQWPRAPCYPRKVVKVVGSWCASLRFPPRARNMAVRTAQAVFEQLQLPSCPPQWAQQEASMAAVVADPSRA